MRTALPLKGVTTLKSYAAALLLSALMAGLYPASAAAQDIEGKAGMGATVGVVKYTAGDDWSDGSTRFSGQASFQYGVTNKLSVQLEAGGAWNNNGGANEAQGVLNDTLSVVFPATLGLLYRFQLGDTHFWPHIGAGAGIYRMGVKDSYRHWAEDPVTGETMLWTGYGGYGKIGTDYFFSDNISVNFDLVNHYISADESDRYTNRFSDENVSMIQFRTGVNYFFSLGSEEESMPMEPDDEDAN